MSTLDKPRPVWISPEMIGKKRREPNPRRNVESIQVTESGHTNHEELASDLVQDSELVALGAEQTANKSTTTDPITHELDSSMTQLLASMVPLPESDSDDLDSPGSPRIIAQEARVPPEMETPSGLATPSRYWSSPTYSDEGVAALVWVSPQIAEYERWMIVKANLKTMELIPRSPFVPRSFSDWLTHRAEMIDIKVSAFLIRNFRGVYPEGCFRADLLSVLCRFRN